MKNHYSSSSHDKAEQLLLRRSKANGPSTSSSQRQEIPNLPPKARKTPQPAPLHLPPARVSPHPGVPIAPMLPTSRLPLPPRPHWLAMPATSHCLPERTVHHHQPMPIQLSRPLKGPPIQCNRGNSHSCLHSWAEPHLPNRPEEDKARPQEDPTMCLQAWW